MKLEGRLSKAKSFRKTISKALGKTQKANHEKVNDTAVVQPPETRDDDNLLEPELVVQDKNDDVPNGTNMLSDDDSQESKQLISTVERILTENSQGPEQNIDDEDDDDDDDGSSSAQRMVNRGSFSHRGKAADRPRVSRNLRRFENNSDSSESEESHSVAASALTSAASMRSDARSRCLSVLREDDYTEYTGTLSLEDDPLFWDDTFDEDDEDFYAESIMVPSTMFEAMQELLDFGDVESFDNISLDDEEEFFSDDESTDSAGDQSRIIESPIKSIHSVSSTPSRRRQMTKDSTASSVQKKESTQQFDRSGDSASLKAKYDVAAVREPIYAPSKNLAVAAPQPKPLRVGTKIGHPDAPTPLGIEHSVRSFQSITRKSLARSKEDSNVKEVETHESDQPIELGRECSLRSFQKMKTHSPRTSNDKAALACHEKSSNPKKSPARPAPSKRKDIFTPPSSPRKHEMWSFGSPRKEKKEEARDRPPLQIIQSSIKPKKSFESDMTLSRSSAVSGIEVSSRQSVASKKSTSPVLLKVQEDQEPDMRMKTVTSAAATSSTKQATGHASPDLDVKINTSKNHEGASTTNNNKTSRRRLLWFGHSMKKKRSVASNRKEQNDQNPKDKKKSVRKEPLAAKSQLRPSGSKSTKGLNASPAPSVQARSSKGTEESMVTPNSKEESALPPATSNSRLAVTESKNPANAGENTESAWNDGCFFELCMPPSDEELMDSVMIDQTRTGEAPQDGQTQQEGGLNGMAMKEDTRELAATSMTATSDPEAQDQEANGGCFDQLCGGAPATEEEEVTLLLVSEEEQIEGPKQKKKTLSKPSEANVQSPMTEMKSNQEMEDPTANTGCFADLCGGNAQPSSSSTKEEISSEYINGTSQYPQNEVHVEYEDVDDETFIRWLTTSVCGEKEYPEETCTPATGESTSWMDRNFEAPRQEEDEVHDETFVGWLTSNTCGDDENARIVSMNDDSTILVDNLRHAPPPKNRHQHQQEEKDIKDGDTSPTASPSMFHSICFFLESQAEATTEIVDPSLRNRTLEQQQSTSGVAKIKEEREELPSPSMLGCLFSSPSSSQPVCVHCQKPFSFLDSQAEVDVGDPRSKVRGEVHKACQDEKAALELKLRSVNRQVALFGALKKKRAYELRAKRLAKMKKEKNKSQKGVFSGRKRPTQVTTAVPQQESGKNTKKKKTQSVFGKMLHRDSMKQAQKTGGKKGLGKKTKVVNKPRMKNKLGPVQENGKAAIHNAVQHERDGPPYSPPTRTHPIPPTAPIRSTSTPAKSKSNSKPTVPAGPRISTRPLVVPATGSMTSHGQLSVQPCPRKRGMKVPNIRKTPV